MKVYAEETKEDPGMKGTSIPKDENPWKMGFIILTLVVFVSWIAGIAYMAGGSDDDDSTTVVATSPAPSPAPMSADDLIMQAHSSGQYEACGPEQLMWTHHPDVYGGFSGCVGENGYNPCAQDGFSGISATGKPYLYNISTGTCTPTSYTWADREFWILWGHPQDKYELTKRTGLNPVVSFPFNRGPYPSMLESGGDHGDDAADARATAKDLLVYLGAFTETELSLIHI